MSVEMIIGIIIGIIFDIFLISFFLIELIIIPIKNSIKQIKAEKVFSKEYGPRKQCVDCSYCKTKLYRPFYNSDTFAQRIPSYCRKYKRALPSKMETRCIAKAEYAMRENGPDRSIK